MCSLAVHLLSTCCPLAVHQLSTCCSLAVRSECHYFDNNHKKLTNEQIYEIKAVNTSAKELLNIVGNSITNKDFFNEAIETRFQSFKSQMNSFKASQAERLVAGNSSSFQNLLYLSHFDYCERLVLNSMKLATAMKKFFVS